MLTLRCALCGEKIDEKKEEKWNSGARVCEPCAEVPKEKVTEILQRRIRVK